MGQSGSTPASASNEALNTSVKPSSHPPTASPDDTSAAVCPVDHKSREAWLKAAQQQQQSAESSGTPPAQVRPRLTNSRLSTHREISTIPRAFDEAHSTPSTAPAPGTPSSSASHGSPYTAPPPPQPQSQQSTPNAQTSDPHTSEQGTWVYPSEEMFYNAMRRKNYSPSASDMPNVIPIHNAVNERTWSEIRRWEAPYTCVFKCPLGPKLVSFSGDSSKLSPRARWNGLLGYESPFDRHDWVVDRCGTRVEYVIDFYQGKAPKQGGGGGMGPSFYLDVRPKLNSWEGVRMRVVRALGLEGSAGHG